MSSKKTTTTEQSQQFNNQFQFDPASSVAYQNALKFFGNIMQNPFGDPFFEAAKGQVNAQALGLGQRAQTNFLNNALVSGMTGAPSGFFQSGLARIGRNTGSLQAQGLLNLIASQGQRQFGAAAALMHPLQTGVSGTSSGQGTTTQSSSGGFLGPLLSFGGGLLSPGGLFGSGGSTFGSSGGFGTVPMTMGGGFGGGFGTLPNYGMAGTNPLFNSYFGSNPMYTSPSTGAYISPIFGNPYPNPQ